MKKRFQLEFNLKIVYQIFFSSRTALQLCIRMNWIENLFSKKKIQQDCGDDGQQACITPKYSPAPVCFPHRVLKIKLFDQISSYFSRNTIYGANLIYLLDLIANATNSVIPIVKWMY